jgi:hypothetical protein
MLYWPGHTHVVGFYTFAVLVVVIGTILAWLVFLLVRSIVMRFLRRRRLWIATLAGALAALLVAGVGLGTLTLPAFNAIDIEGPAVVFVLVPYGGLAMVLYSDIAQDIIGATATSGGPPITAQQIQLIVWAISSGFLLLIALFLWVRAIVLFDSRR